MSIGDKHRKKYVIFIAQLQETGKITKRKNMTIRIPKDQWIVNVNKAVNAKPIKLKRGRK